MKPLSKCLIAVCFLVLTSTLAASTPAQYAERIASLIEPAKLATLGKRGANPRVQKYVAQLAGAKSERLNVTNIVAEAVARAGMKGEAAALTREAMLRNLTIADRLGCLDVDGLKDMRKGKAATVKRGPYKGQELSVDHIIPRAVVPELDNVIANLELMPERLNASKGDKVGERQVDLGKKLLKAGLLSRAGMDAINRKRSGTLDGSTKWVGNEQVTAWNMKFIDGRHMGCITNSARILNRQLARNNHQWCLVLRRRELC